MRNVVKAPFVGWVMGYVFVYVYVYVCVFKFEG